MEILIKKKARQLTVLEDHEAVFSCRVALGSSPAGKKTRQGDGKTPEGVYFVCVKRTGKYGKSLGVSYPSMQDAQDAGVTDQQLLALFCRAEETKTRPPWGTALGGEICIHAGGSARDWTAGCIALDDRDMEQVYAMIGVGDCITILP